MPPCIPQSNTQTFIPLVISAVKFLDLQNTPHIMVKALISRPTITRKVLEKKEFLVGGNTVDKHCKFPIGKRLFRAICERADDVFCEGDRDPKG